MPREYLLSTARAFSESTRETNADECDGMPGSDMEVRGRQPQFHLHRREKSGEEREDELLDYYTWPSGTLSELPSKFHAQFI
jgi:hypothetical protein